MPELYQLSAIEMVSHLKLGKVSPTEAVKAAYNRIEEVEATINAMPTLCRNRALKAAKAIENDRTIRTERKDDPTWLAGLPIAIKDLVDVAGVLTTYGSPIYSKNIPERSDIMVEKLEGNGAIIIGKSNTPEFGSGGNTFNQIFPSTTTPWDTNKSAGGSSGGSAAALASGSVWLATGSDYGGSLRTPASFCGVVGLRPSPGRIANGPRPLPFDTMAVEGPMARTVGDTALLLDAMIGLHSHDPISIAPPKESFISAIRHDEREIRAAYSPDLGLTPVAPEVANLCEKAVNKLSGEGWKITDTAPNFSNAMETFHAIRAAYYAASMAGLMSTNRDQLKADIIWNTNKGINQSVYDLCKAKHERGVLFHRMASFFETHDLLITPTACIPPFPVEWQYPKEFNGEASTNYMEWLRLPCALSLTGSPVISLPVGITDSGLPVGMQFCGPYIGEDRLISATYQAEQILGMNSATPLNPRLTI